MADYAKKSFVMYLDQRAIFEALSARAAGELVKGIFAYSAGETPQFSKSLAPVLLPVFAAIQQTLIRDQKKWDAVANRNRENIKKRYQKLPKPTKSTSGRIGIPNPLDSGSVSVSVSDSLAKRLSALLADNYSYKNSKHYRKTTNGWQEIHNPVAYLKKVESTSQAPETSTPEKSAHDMTDDELRTYFSGKKIGLDSDIPESYVYEAMERRIL